MLVLTRTVGASIFIGDPKKPEECIEIVVVEARGNGAMAAARLGIEAPDDVKVHRKEVYDSIQQENRAAAQASPADVPSRPSQKPATK